MPATFRFHQLPALLAAITAIGSLVTLAGTAIWQRWLPAALWHIVFAVGALPLILSAMAYFTPVLTRTPEAPKGLAALPLIALVAGLGIVGWFVHGIESMRYLAPWLAFAATIGLAFWMHRRRRACLGPPHACLRWYSAALFCLALGLIAVGVSAPWSDYSQALRIFHLHINTLGFMGLTAIGTLQVLLPTVLGQPDPAAPRRLARDLPWSVAGVLGIAIGAAWWWPMAMLASIAYAWPLLRMIRDMRVAFGNRLWLPGQAGPLLLAAMVGLAMILVHGLIHGVGMGRARDVLPLFLIGFLLPLVSGAVTQLLPIWLHPGAAADWHKSQRSRLAAFARLRAALLLGGGLLAAAGIEAGYFVGMLGAAWLMAAMALAMAREIRSPRPPR
ncbi:MAG TPA: hypothetical protein VFF82_08455 [Rhodocyclaceae bacterium]|nr:hypothetical protein [Rhodocyclaceae bacterium]